jgi:hypothetical protein
VFGFISMKDFKQIYKDNPPSAKSIIIVNKIPNWENADTIMGLIMKIHKQNQIEIIMFLLLLRQVPQLLHFWIGSKKDISALHLGQMILRTDIILNFQVRHLTGAAGISRQFMPPEAA